MSLQMLKPVLLQCTFTADTFPMNFSRSCIFKLQYQTCAAGLTITDYKCKINIFCNKRSKKSIGFTNFPLSLPYDTTTRFSNVVLQVMTASKDTACIKILTLSTL